MHPWFAALLGGILIGLASTWLLWSNGRIASISGIVDGLVKRASADERAWRDEQHLCIAGVVVHVRAIAEKQKRYASGRKRRKVAPRPYQVGADIENVAASTFSHD